MRLTDYIISELGPARNNPDHNSRIPLNAVVSVYWSFVSFARGLVLIIVIALLVSHCMQLSLYRMVLSLLHRDLGGVTAAIMSIDTSLTEVDGSGSEICSPDDEDCDVFSGSGLAAEDVVKSSAVVTSAAAIVSADDIVYVHRSTAEDGAGGFQSSSSTSSSSSFSLSPLSTTFTSSSTQSSVPSASAAPETPFPSTLSSSYFSPTGTSALNASSDDRKSGLTRLRTIPVMTKPSGVSTVDAPTTASVTQSPPDASVEMVHSAGEKEATPPRAPLEPVYSPPDPRYGMIDQLTMNIGLILGIAIALVLLLAMLAFVLFQYRTSKEGNQTKTPGDVKVPPPYGGNTKQPMSAACRIDTTQPSADKKLSPIKTAAENNVTCSSRRKDVKEWYV